MVNPKALIGSRVRYTGTDPFVGAGTCGEVQGRNYPTAGLATLVHVAWDNETRSLVRAADLEPVTPAEVEAG